MLDLIRAILGPRHCDWCGRHDRWLENKANCFAGEPRRQKLWIRTYWKLNHLDYKIGLWKIGRRIHFRYHHGRSNNGY